MTLLTIIIGALLTATGVVAYTATGAASVTALIPAFVGVVLLVLGLVARLPKAHRHAIHAALVVALLGAIGAVPNVIRIGQVVDGSAARPAAVVVSVIMFVLLVVYLVLGVRSFVAARRARTRSA